MLLNEQVANPNSSAYDRELWSLLHLTINMGGPNSSPPGARGHKACITTLINGVLYMQLFQNQVEF